MTEKKTKIEYVIAGVLLGIFISAMDNTIVATATGNIVSHLGGIDKIFWITAAYMVTEMTGMPIFGKLSDMYGRKRFFVFGLSTFLLGSMLCGTAHNMDQLAIYRAIQGIGGGALTPIAFTIIFDIVPRDQMGKYSGMLGAVFGIASIFGPLLGSFITENFGWQWVFYINVPVGIVTLYLVVFFYHEAKRHFKQSIDWLGIIILIPSIVSLMFGLELGGNQFPWNSPVIVGLFAAVAVLFTLFFFVEFRAKEPVVSFHMFTNRVFAGSNMVGLLSGSAYIVAVIYIPIYIQGVLGGSAINAGLDLLPMMIASSITAHIGGQLANKMPYRNVLFPFGLLFILGIFLLATLTPDSSTVKVMLYMMIVGLGIGPSFSVVGMAAMSEFGAHQRGAASSTNSFVRELGMAVGIVIFGVIQKDLFQNRLQSTFAGMQSGVSGVTSMDTHAMLSPATRAHIPAVILQKLTIGLSYSVTHSLLLDLIPSVLALILLFWMGNGRFKGMDGTSDAQKEVDAEV